jgi:hypothetical protein
MSITTEGLIGRAILSADPIDRAAAEDLAVLLSAVQRRIFCPYTGAVLDVRSAVLVTLPGQPPTVMAGKAWAAIADSVMASRPLTIVVNGADYRADGKLTAKARKIRAASSATIAGE